MKKAKASTKLLPFDAARYLTDDAAVAEYMTAVLETDDPDLLLLALGDVARPAAWRRWRKTLASGGRVCTRRSLPAQSRVSTRC